MIHRQLGKGRRIKEASSFVCAGFLGLLVAAPSQTASAGEFDRSTLPAAAADPAQCGSGSEASALLKDSGDCKRINGYIAAGARFGTDEEIGGRRSLFGPLDAPGFVGGVRASGATMIDAPSGQDRFFLPPDRAEEAR